MAISSGRCRIPSMELAREFFGVNEPFWYTPLADKDTTILIEATPCKSVVRHNYFSQAECETYCAICKWCAESGNFNDRGENYIPCCSDYERKDKTGVFFKEIGIG